VERTSGAVEGGSVGDYYEVINKRILNHFFLSHFWPLGAAYMSALTGGYSLIIRPKTKEYVYAHSHPTEYLGRIMSLYYLLSFGCLYVRKFHTSSLESLKRALVTEACEKNSKGTDQV